VAGFRVEFIRRGMVSPPNLAPLGGSSLVSKAHDFGCYAPQTPGTLRHIPTQGKINSETEKQSAFEYGPVCPNMSLR